ncbi:putative hydrolase of the HAD superfamily [Haloechinothrix alba]|uniref:Putative hydrolase of the HAD superfamily n=1 Tax=Haloechinothrix alba TaxID=664784 RepID=A0A238VM64_9PSEU|nr:putative hydrolase of the HAD superfamily [Haloechinothrix alba]
MEFASPFSSETYEAVPRVEIPDDLGLRAVCLDIDDTLVDFSAAGRRALAAMIGRDDMWPVWERLTELHVARVVADRLDYASMHRQRTKSFLDELGVAVSDEDAARFERRRAALVQCHWDVYGDVLPCLEWLRAAGIALAAVTNASGAHQRKKLDTLGLSRYFGHVAIAGEVGAAKPDPLIFHSACAALGCDPAEAVHVGDKLEADAAGAVRAGLGGVWLDRHGRCESDRDTDVQVISGLDELPSVLVADLGRAGVPVPR